MYYGKRMIFYRIQLPDLFRHLLQSATMFPYIFDFKQDT